MFLLLKNHLPVFIMVSGMLRVVFLLLYLSCSSCWEPLLYDRYTTQYTPSGSILQLEYAHRAALDHTLPVLAFVINPSRNDGGSVPFEGAREAPPSGTPPPGTPPTIKKKSIMFGLLRRSSPLRLPAVQNFYQISPNIVSVATGLALDASAMASLAREAQNSFEEKFGSDYDGGGRKVYYLAKEVSFKLF